MDGKEIEQLRLDFIELRTTVKDYLANTHIYRSSMSEKLEKLRVGQEEIKDEMHEIRSNCLARPPACVNLIDTKIKQESAIVLKQARAFVAVVLGIPTTMAGIIGVIMLIKNILGK